MPRIQPFADRLLAQMPPLRALRCFVTAERYESFTQAADVLCVTQAAVSRQIKELEDSLDIALFERTGRHIALTEAGKILYNASYLSIMNIAESVEALRRQERRVLIVCVSLAFSALWLAPRLAAFRRQCPQVRLHVVVTDHYREFDGLIEPDVIITKNPPREAAEYAVKGIFHDIVYPVCSKQFFEDKFRGKRPSALELLRHPMLSLSPLGRTHLGEHVDWRVWRNWFQEGDVDERSVAGENLESNDYRLLVSQAEAGEGVLLGWHHLVHRQVESGLLVRPAEESLVFHDRHHHLVTHRSALERTEYAVFREWLEAEVETMLSSWHEPSHARKIGSRSVSVLVDLS
ncbi:LysR family transcriptional regulator [Caballeronia arvi]|nr:LysR family transcriptional regulator [Caballeronia arvi]